MQFKFVNDILASEASQKKILDFDVSNQPISEFGLHYWRQIFFHCAIEQDYFLKSISEKGFFFEKSQQKQRHKKVRL